MAIAAMSTDEIRPAITVSDTPISIWIICAISKGPASLKSAFASIRNCRNFNVISCLCTLMMQVNYNKLSIGRTDTNSPASRREVSAGIIKKQFASVKEFIIPDPCLPLGLTISLPSYSFHIVALWNSVLPARLLMLVVNETHGANLSQHTTTRYAHSSCWRTKAFSLPICSQNCDSSGLMALIALSTLSWFSWV